MAFQKQDPILHLKIQMIESGLIDEEHYKDMDERVRQKCDEAVTVAEAGQLPTYSALEEDVYA